MNENTVLPKSYYVIAIVGLIWNLMGFFAFYTEYTYWSRPDSRVDLQPEMAAMYDHSPAWLYVIFAVALISGSLGCLALLLRKSWAVPLFTISLLSVIIQMGYFLGTSGVLDIIGPSALLMPFIVICIAAYLLFYARGSRARGWL